MQVSEGAMNFEGFMVDYAGRNSRDRIRKLVERGSRRGIRVRLRRPHFALRFMDRYCGPEDQMSLHLLSHRSFTPYRETRVAAFRLERLSCEGGRYPRI